MKLLPDADVLLSSLDGRPLRGARTRADGRLTVGGASRRRAGRNDPGHGTLGQEGRREGDRDGGADRMIPACAARSPRGTSSRARMGSISRAGGQSQRAGFSSSHEPGAPAPALIGLAPNRVLFQRFSRERERVLSSQAHDEPRQFVAAGQASKAVDPRETWAAVRTCGGRPRA